MWHKRFVLVLWVGLCCSTSLWACHQGGPMGFAEHNPGMFTLDLTMSSSSTLPFASTSGTLKCKNWDFAEWTPLEQFIHFQWESLQEEAAQGTGTHLVALAQMSQCSNSVSFQKFVHQHYAVLFKADQDSLPPQDFLRELQHWLPMHPTLVCDLSSIAKS